MLRRRGGTGALLVGVALFLVFLVGASVRQLTVDLAADSDSLSQRQAELQAQFGASGQTSVVNQVLSTLDPATLLNAVRVFLGALVNIGTMSLLIFLVTGFLLVEAEQFVSRMRRTFGADHGVTVS